MWFQAGRKGEVWVGPPEMQEFTKRVGMPIAVPLRASFDQSRVVGVLVEVIDWPKVVETLQSVKVLPEGQNDRGYLLLTDAKGTLLSAPAFVTAWEAGKTRAQRRSASTRVNAAAAQAPTGSTTIDARSRRTWSASRRARRDRNCPASGAWRCCCEPTWPLRRWAA